MAQTKKKKRQNKTWPIAIGAVAVGLVAALLSGLYLKSREAAIRAALEGDEVREVTVVVASRNLPRGSVVSAENFAVRRVPEKFVHEDAVFPNEFERYEGRSIIAAVGAGKTLLKTFMDDTFPVDFSDVIPKGRRAMTVSVDEVNSVAGFIRPGNHIDVFVNIPFNASGFDASLLTQGLPALIPDALADMVPQELLDQAAELPPEIINRATPADVIMPVIQNVRVLAAGRTPYRESLDFLRQPQQLRERTFTNVTLDLSPRQAALVATALDKGELLALLRNRGDDGTADFTTVSSRDLFSNAKLMAEAEAERQSRTTVAGGVDGAGNLVDAEGKRIMSRRELEAAGYQVNAQGRVVDRNGNVVDPKDLVVGADGKVYSRQELAAAGLKVNESGQVVDEDGNIVSATDLVTGADGKVYTRRQLAAAGLAVNERGEIVDADGRVVAADDLVTGADGKVYSQRKLAAAGLRVNESGQVVDKDGNVVAAGELVTAADGKVYTRQQLAAAGLAVNERGEIVNADGRVVAADDLVTGADGKVYSKAQLAATGLTMNERGEIVDAKGKVVDPDSLVTMADGTVRPRDDLARAGLTVNSNGQVVDARTGEIVSDDQARERMDMAAAGLAYNDNGDIVDTKTGRVLSAGEAEKRMQMAAAGMTVNDKGQVVDSRTGEVLGEAAVAARLSASDGTQVALRDGRIQIIVGGASKDGVAKVEELPITE